MQTAVGRFAEAELYSTKGTATAPGPDTLSQQADTACLIREEPHHAHLGRLQHQVVERGKQHIRHDSRQADRLAM